MINSSHLLGGAGADKRDGEEEQGPGDGALLCTA